MTLSMTAVFCLGLTKRLRRVPTAEELGEFLSEIASEPLRRQRVLACGAAIDCGLPQETWGWELPPENKFLNALENGFHASEKDDVARSALDTLRGEAPVPLRTHAGRVLIGLLWDNRLNFDAEVREELASGLDGFLEKNSDSPIAKILRLTIAELASQSAKEVRRANQGNRFCPSAN